mmetsp:Transcript_49657/g.112760  ORF Transcript_49657/g.112760 Transcript_49657/m.112760 type:complete len:274 (-) Transcript_49657:178-999(-)
MPGWGVLVNVLIDELDSGADDEGPSGAVAVVVVGQARHRLWEVAILDQVLTRRQSSERALGVDYAEVVGLGPFERLVGLGKGARIGARRELAARGHDRAQGRAPVLDQLHVLALHQPNQLPADQTRHRQGHTADALFGDELVQVADWLVGPHARRPPDEAVLELLHRRHARCLDVHRALRVDESDAALQRHADGHVLLGHRVHGRRDEGAAQRNPLRNSRSQLHIVHAEVYVRRVHDQIVKGVAPRSCRTKNLLCAVAVYYFVFINFQGVFEL